MGEPQSDGASSSDSGRTVSVLDASGHETDAVQWVEPTSEEIAEAEAEAIAVADAVEKYQTQVKEEEQRLDDAWRAYENKVLQSKQDVVSANKELQEKVISRLEWKNREDWPTRGRTKGVAGLAPLALAVGAVAAPALGPAALVASLAGTGFTYRRGMSTVKVISELKKLTGLSDAARKDVEYILRKKTHKAVKSGKVAGPVAAAMLQAPILSTGVSATATVYGAAKSVIKSGKETKGKHRHETATRILDKLMENDPSYRSIARALFVNQDDPMEWVTLLQVCPPSHKELAVKVLMGKIASK